MTALSATMPSQARPRPPPSGRGSARSAVECGLAALAGQEAERVNVVVMSSLLDQGVVSRTRV
jgi:hypothetical protein